MRRLPLTLTALLVTVCALAQGVRTETILKEWDFRRGHDVEAAEGWEKVAVPHDWAIYGPFDAE